MINTDCVNIVSCFIHLLWLVPIQTVSDALTYSIAVTIVCGKSNVVICFKIQVLLTDIMAMWVFIGIFVVQTHK